ncbi:MAG: type II secretion system protein, partial [Rickettsiales bacterium]
MHSRLFSRFSHGFTLMELSIVLVILSLVASGGLMMGSAMVEQASYIDTQNNIEQINQSLKDYYVVNGALPCAAPINQEAPGEAGFGEALADCTAAAGTQRDNGVRIDMVPTRTLGLSDAAAQDKYGNRLVYAVTEGLTDKGNFGATLGAVAIEDDNGNAITTAAYAVVSPGKDHKGAYSYKTGADISPVDCATSTQRDASNCDGDATFRSAAYNAGQADGDDLYDDLIAFTPKFHLTSTETVSASLWAQTAGQDHIYSVGTDEDTTTGNVGIGTAVPAVSLDIHSNIATGNSPYLRLRNTSGATVGSFGPGIILDNGVAGKNGYVLQQYQG